jgi:hypothetical protein
MHGRTTATSTTPKPTGNSQPPTPALSSRDCTLSSSDSGDYFNSGYPYGRTDITITLDSFGSLRRWTALEWLLHPGGIWSTPQAMGRFGSGFLNVTNIESPVAAVPLAPSAVVHITGLGLLGLLAWRRKRKAAAGDEPINMRVPRSTIFAPKARAVIAR